MKKLRKFISEDITDTNLKSLFDEFNRTLFQNSLPKITIKWVSMKNKIGSFSFTIKKERGLITPLKAKFIKISKTFDLPLDRLKGIVAHEMIHYWVFLNGLETLRAVDSPHGLEFQNKKKQIQKLVKFKILDTENVEDLDLTVSAKKKTKELNIILLKTTRGYFIQLYTPSVFSKAANNIIRIYSNLVNSGKYSVVYIALMHTNLGQAYKIVRKIGRRYTSEKISDVMAEQLIKDIKNLRKFVELLPGQVNKGSSKNIQQG